MSQQINQIIARLNAIAQNARKIIELPNVTSGEKWLPLFNENNEVTEKISLNSITSQTGLPDGLISLGTRTIEDETIFFSTGFSWRINGQIAGNSSIVEIPIPLATDSRFDVFFGDINGNIFRIQGEDSETPEIPNNPVNTVVISVILVTSTNIEPEPIPDLTQFLEKQTFAYTPLSSTSFEEAPLAMNFITTDGDGVDEFFGFATGSVFAGKRMIIRNEKSVDFPCSSFVPEFSLTFDFTFDKNYIIKAGESMEFDFAQGKFKRVGLDGIPRLGTVESEPIEGDLEFAGEGADYGIKWQNADATFMNYLYLFADRLRFAFENFSLDTPVDLLEGSGGVIATRNFVNGLAVEESFTAEANGRYRTTANLTITDPSSGNYFVMVESGTTTIGGVAYVAGDWIWRVGSTSYKINGTGGGGGGTWGSITGTLSAQTDLQTELDSKLDKEILPLSITTDVDASDLDWNDREVEIDNGTADITITIDTDTRVYGTKTGSGGSITFVSGSGRTQKLLSQENVCTSKYSKFNIGSVGTDDVLSVLEVEALLYKKISAFRSPVIATTDWTGTNPRIASVVLTPSYVTDNYQVAPEFAQSVGSWAVQNKTAAGFDFYLYQGTAPTTEIQITTMLR